MHPIPATAKSAEKGLLDIVPVTFLVGFHALPLLTPSSQDTALSKRRSAVRVRSGSPTSVLLAQATLGPKGRSNTRISWPTIPLPR